MRATLEYPKWKRDNHRIIDDRIEKSIKGRLIGHNLQCRNEECLSRREMDTKGGWSNRRGAGPVLPWRTLRPPPVPFPTPGQAWDTYVFCGCCLAGTTARANAITQIVPNLSSLYTLFYSVIYNSVTQSKICPVILLDIFKILYFRCFWAVCLLSLSIFFLLLISDNMPF